MTDYKARREGQSSFAVIVDFDMASAERDGSDLAVKRHDGEYVASLQAKFRSLELLPETRTLTEATI